MNDAPNTIEHILETDGVFVGTTTGISMRPLFAERRDIIVIVPVTGRLKKYDVPMYRRGNDYVLHRIIRVREDSYDIRGDNCVLTEYGIKDDQIVGVLKEFYRKGKHGTVNDLSYRLYAVLRVATHFAVPLRFRVRTVLARVYHKLKKG